MTTVTCEALGQLACTSAAPLAVKPTFAAPPVPGSPTPGSGSDCAEALSAVETLRARRRAALAAVVSTPEPRAANRLITRTHHELGLLLGDALGEDPGANFHSWAVWGSREAGRTISGQDVAGLAPATGALGAVLGGLLGWWAGSSPLLVAVVLAIAFAGVVGVHLSRASTHIAHGNRIVLEEIGAATIDFLAAVGLERVGDRHAINRFLATLAPGATDHGGQQLLRRAFAAYADAIDASARSTRHQFVFAANCLAVRHEHIRLQHDISRSMPALLRRAITRRLLDFWVGDQHLHVGRDLVADAGNAGHAYPTTLQTLTVPVARAAVAELRDPLRPIDSLTRSAAADWTVLDQRMNYVVDLFRSRHLAPEVLTVPYPETVAELLPR